MLAASDSVSLMAISVRSLAVQQAGGDPQLQEAAQQAQAAGEPLQIRFSPQVYKPATRTYASWRDTSWTVGVPGAEEAEQVKAAVEAFFAAVATGDVEGLRGVLVAFRGERA